MATLFITDLETDHSQNILIPLASNISPLTQKAVKRSLDARQIVGGYKSGGATCGWRCPMEF